VVNCTAVLSYTAELVRPGLVSFTYQSEDDSILFTFEVFVSRILNFLLCVNFTPGRGYGGGWGSTLASRATRWVRTRDKTHEKLLGTPKYTISHQLVLSF